MLGERFGLVPQRGEVMRAHHRERGRAAFFGAPRQFRNAAAQRQRRETAVSVHAQRGRAQLLHARFGRAVYFAAAQCGDIAGNAKQAVRLRAVAFGRGNGVGDRGRVLFVASVVGKASVRERMHLLGAHFNGVGHDFCRKRGAQ